MEIPQKSYPVDGLVLGLSTLNETRTWRLKEQVYNKGVNNLL